jgi:hypothetical protein
MRLRTLIVLAALSTGPGLAGAYGRPAGEARPAPPAEKLVQFTIPVGEAPFLGPADAKVTILHYLDYQ